MKSATRMRRTRSFNCGIESINSMRESVEKALTQHSELLEKVQQSLLDDVVSAAQLMIEALEDGNKILLCGNGGSAADAQHISAELTGRFLKERKPLAAVALTTDTSALTALGNDFGFEEIFARQVRALARPGDVCLGISTSGNSENVNRAMRAAKEADCVTIALIGGDGCRMKESADGAIVVPSSDTPRIQEMHITIGHILCDLIDTHFAAR